jgi:hypothetical protein
MPQGTSVYAGAVTTSAAYLVDGTYDGDHIFPARWFESPCTFSGFSPPDRAQMELGVPSGVECVYPIDIPPYRARAAVFVDYPFFARERVKLVEPIRRWTSTDNDVAQWRSPISPPAPDVVLAKVGEVLGLHWQCGRGLLEGPSALVCVFRRPHG